VEAGILTDEDNGYGKSADVHMGKNVQGAAMLLKIL
jgi:hypothetical protein